MADYPRFPGYPVDPRVWHILERCRRLAENIRKRSDPANYYAFGTLNSKKCLRRKDSAPPRPIYPRRKKYDDGASVVSVSSSVPSRRGARSPSRSPRSPSAP
jgi:hypothetical protein